MNTIHPLTRVIGGTVAVFSLNAAWEHYKTLGRTFRSDQTSRYFAQRDLETFRESQYQFSGIPVMDKAANLLRWMNADWDKTWKALTLSAQGFKNDFLIRNAPMLGFAAVGLGVGFHDWLGQAASYAWQKIKGGDVFDQAFKLIGNAVVFTLNRGSDVVIGGSRLYGKWFAANPILTVATSALALFMVNTLKKTMDGSNQSNLYQQEMASYSPYLKESPLSGGRNPFGG
jgi:hypothetical protein